MGVIGKLRGRLLRRAVEREVARELGDKSLAYLSRVMLGLIPLVGFARMRTRVLNGIRSDLTRAAKRGGSDAVSTLMEEALDTPDYIALLKALELDRSDIEMIADEVLGR